MNIWHPIKTRLQGEHIKEISRLRKSKTALNRLILGPEEDAVRKHLLKLADLQMKCYFMFIFFGSKITRTTKLCALPEDYLIDTLLKLYPTDDENILRMGDIKFPRPASHFEKAQFLVEFNDLFLPCLLKNEGMLDTVVYNEGPYELNSVRLREGDIVFDCGANIGAFSAAASAKGCKVYAFEPMKSTVDAYLSKTAAYNKNINIVNCALSDKKCRLDFIIAHSGDGGATAYMSKSSGTHVSVDATTIDSFVEENKTTRVDFIKADIEGAERYMLKGAKNTLKTMAPKLSICTYHMKDDPEAIRSAILDANPDYVIEERYKKLYAYVPGRE